MSCPARFRDGRFAEASLHYLSCSVTTMDKSPAPLAVTTKAATHNPALTGTCKPLLSPMCSPGAIVTVASSDLPVPRSSITHVPPDGGVPAWASTRTMVPARAIRSRPALTAEPGSQKRYVRGVRNGLIALGSIVPLRSTTCPTACCMWISCGGFIASRTPDSRMMRRMLWSLISPAPSVGFGLGYGDFWYNGGTRKPRRWLQHPEARHPGTCVGGSRNAPSVYPKRDSPFLVQGRYERRPQFLLGMAREPRC